MTKKTIKAQYRYIGDSDGWYKCGETYYLTVQYKRFLWRKYIEVSCRRGGHDQRYPGSPVLIYGNEQAFNDEWQVISPQL